MSPTTILFLIFYITGIILTLKKPHWGIALYIFEWHNHPPYMWWGKGLPDLHWSMVVSLVTLLSLFINYNKLKPLKNANYNLIWWMVAFTIWMYFISMFFAIVPAASYKRANNFLKLTLQVFIMMFLIRDIEEFKQVIWTMLFSVANFGRISYQRGGNRYLGVIAPSATEENAVSAHVASILPFFGLYFLTGKRWEKIVTLISIPFLLNLIILANSRATFVAVLVISLLSLIWIKGRLRWYVLLSLLGGVFLFLFLANDQFWQRQNTIETYQQEGSAMSRIYLWGGAIRMWKDHPMGAGGKAFHEMAIDYIPELAVRMKEKGAKTAHSTFFLTLVEWGPVGIFLFFGFTIHMFIILGHIRKRSRYSPGYHYYVDAMALQLGIIVIFVAGIFHNRIYSEGYYWFAAFAVVLQNLQNDEILSNDEPITDSDNTRLEW